MESYINGQTPIPCVRCNQTVKFRDLLAVARDLNADCMATGHYIQRVENPETHRAELHKAVDDTKDQSYFLFATTQEQLDFLRFPLGGWTKDITRQHAERLGLIVCDKPDSQDICFVPNGDYASVVKKIRPDAQKAGEIIHLDGRVMGEHDGIIHYTIGQRRGLGIGGGHNDDNSPFYVVKVDPKNNQVIVGPKEALARDLVTITDCNWLLSEQEMIRLSESQNLKTRSSDHPIIRSSVKLRSVSKTADAILHIYRDNAAQIHLLEPQYGIAAGQAAVCYDGTRVLGGGWIKSAENSKMPLAA